MIRLAAIGIASTGKSALLNALFGTAFHVDARANSTFAVLRASVRFLGRELEVLDTPPLGAAPPADCYLLVCDKDLTDVEYREAARLKRPLGVAVNKCDLYNGPQRRQLLQQVKRRLEGIVPPRRVVLCAAEPVRVTHHRGQGGEIAERHTRAAPELKALLPIVEEIILEAEGSLRVRARTLAAQLKQQLTR